MKKNLLCYFPLSKTGIKRFLLTINLALIVAFLNLSYVRAIGVTDPQQLQVSGKVTDSSTGELLVGATVVVKGTNIGVTTSADGTYTINVPDGSDILVFSYIGYTTQEVNVSGRTTLDVALIPEITGLEEVVVVGYGTQKKVNIVGAVTSLTGDKISSIPASDVTNSISGRLPGSIVIQETGEPGINDARILVRGRTTLGENTDPLIVIDGVPGRSLSEIDPMDIESISVLKDASAAIYGTRAANGVLLITSKKGESGKPKLDYQFYQGFMQPTILPKVLNAGDYATMLSEYQDYENISRTFTDRDIELFYSGEDPWEHPNTDWMGDLVADWTTTSKHNLSISGGGANGMTYYSSFGYKNEEAIYEQESTSYNQYNLRVNLSFPVTKWLTTSLDYAGFINNRKAPTRDAFMVYGYATRLVPTQWSFWPTGEPGPDIEYGDNPVVTSTFQTGYDDRKYYRNQLNFKGSITPEKITGLSVDLSYSLDIDNNYRKYFKQPFLLYFPDWSSAVRDGNGFITSMDLVPTLRGYSTPELNEYYNRRIQELTNVSVVYSRTFGEHSFSLFGGYEQLSENRNDFDAFRKYYISTVVQTIDAGSDTDKDNGGGMSIYARKSWIARLNYNFREKYLIELLFRRDGSLKFPPNSRWGNFPAVLLGWRVSEEDFWKNNLGFINYFKLRGSYGKMGMDPGDAFQYVNKYVLASGMTFGTGKQVETIVQQSGVANPFITWEKQTTYNIGFDSQILDNMFHLNTEFFYSKRSDILASRDASVPNFTGLALPDENIAEVDNRGFEIEAGYHKRLSNGLRFDIGGNISYNHNEVVFMDEPERAVTWQRRTGHSYGAELLYQSIGIFADQDALDAYPHWAGAKPGDVIFEDVSGDGQITSDDQILLDKTDAPEIFYGISIDVVWKSWSLSLLTQGQGEYWRMNIQDDRRGDAGNYFQWHFDDRWTPTNTNTEVARAYNRNEQYWGFFIHNSTYWWDNMAYCRLKNAVLTYNIPNSVVQRIGLAAASVYFSGNNLLLIYSAQRNFDPEIGVPMTYPAVKTFAIGARVTFQ